MTMRDPQGRFTAGSGRAGCVNVDDVVRFLDGFVDSFDFQRVGNDQCLGRDVANKIVERIYDRGLDQRSGVSGIWLANERTYAAGKDRRYGVEEAPNVRTGQMLSNKNLYGRTRIDSREVTMIYGR